MNELDCCDTGPLKPSPDHNIVIILVSATILVKTHSRINRLKLVFPTTY